MSYDLRFAVKGEPDGRFYVVFEPDEYSHPTYNIAPILRKSMGWDYKQGEWYRVSEILPYIDRGIYELSLNTKDYIQYEPKNGYGSIEGALNCLKEILSTVEKRINGWDWNDYELEYLWMSW